jgi:hypothetical protein
MAVNYDGNDLEGWIKHFVYELLVSQFYVTYILPFHK